MKRIGHSATRSLILIMLIMVIATPALTGCTVSHGDGTYIEYNGPDNVKIRYWECNEWHFRSPTPAELEQILNFVN